jgi:2-hydroxy-6-oxonona-2,4-dienedioate hydrolase
MTHTPAPTSTYWVDLIATDVRIIQGKYRTRILEAGRPDAPALLLLHGTGGHLENYARNIAPLAEHFRVIAMDFLWHGRSQTEGYDPEVIPALVDQITDVLDVLGIGQAHLAGQSMGGWVAMQFALQQPARVRRLVLTTTMGYAPDTGAIPGYTEPDWAANLPSSLKCCAPQLRQRQDADGAHPRQPRPAHRRGRAGSPGPLPPAGAGRGAGRVHHRIPGRQHHPPTHRHRRPRPPHHPAHPGYWGDKNRTPPALGQHIARQVQHGRFHCAADTGHWAQFESADEYNAVVTAFLLEEQAATPQGAQEMSISEQFVGRWNLVAWEQRYDDGRLQKPMGEHPRGFIRYTADGEMVVMISREDRRRFEKGGQWDAPDDEKAYAYNTMLSYAGRFSVEGDTVTHHVDMSLFPNWEGGVQKRKFELKPDGTLELTARLEAGTPEARTAALVWRRA